MTLTSFSCIAIPDALKNAASIVLSTANQTPEMRKTLQEGKLPTSPKYVPGTLAAVLIATLATDRIIKSTHTYKILQKATLNVIRHYPSIPVKHRKYVTPALSFVVASTISMSMIPVLKQVCWKAEDELINVFEEYDKDTKKAP